MLLNKRSVFAGLLAATTFAAANNAQAQNYPNRPITVIVPYAGGSASDVVSRVLFEKMASILGQTIVVENKPGAGGNIGTAQAAKATPDGYTLLGVAAGPVTTGLMLYKDIGFEAKDLVLISPFASFTVVITASNKIGVRSVKELIERAKKEPGALNYGSVGIGSSQHLAGEYFSQITGTKLTHVPYRNIAQFGPDLIEGRVQLGFSWYPNIAGPLSANGATALAVAGDKRLTAVLPDTPTTTEAGLPEYKVDGWFGLGGPSGIPQEIQQRLNAALLQALKDPAVLASFEKIGAVQIGRDLSQSKKFWDDEIVKYRQIVTDAGIGKIE
jgi:tripartite-type tricarboxylate transporter receptor subunit TctC